MTPSLKLLADGRSLHYMRATVDMRVGRGVFSVDRGVPLVVYSIVPHIFSNKEPCRYVMLEILNVAPIYLNLVYHMLIYRIVLYYLI